MGTKRLYGPAGLINTSGVSVKDPLSGLTPGQFLKVVEVEGQLYLQSASGTEGGHAFLDPTTHSGLMDDLDTEIQIGDVLMWDGSQLVPAIGGTIGGLSLEYIPIDSTTDNGGSLDIEEAGTYTFNLANLTFDPAYSVSLNRIRTVYIRCKLGFYISGGSSATISLKSWLPGTNFDDPAESVEIAGCFVPSDGDDQGNFQLVALPVDTAAGIIKLVTTGSGSYMDVSLIGVVQERVMPMSPELDTYSIAGDVPNADAATSTTTGNVRDEDAAANLTWADIFPIEVPDGVTKTEIHSTQSPVAVVDSAHEHYGSIHVLIDWANNKINGTFAINKGSGAGGAYVATGIISGTLSAVVFTAVVGSLDIDTPTLEISGRTITKLPVLSDDQHVTYDFKHYKTTKINDNDTHWLGAAAFTPHGDTFQAAQEVFKTAEWTFSSSITTTAVVDGVMGTRLLTGFPVDVLDTVVPGMGINGAGIPLGSKVVTVDTIARTVEISQYLPAAVSNIAVEIGTQNESDAEMNIQEWVPYPMVAEALWFDTDEFRRYTASVMTTTATELTPGRNRITPTLYIGRELSESNNDGKIKILVRLYAALSDLFSDITIDSANGRVVRDYVFEIDADFFGIDSDASRAFTFRKLVFNPGSTEVTCTMTTVDDLSEGNTLPAGSPMRAEIRRINTIDDGVGGNANSQDGIKLFGLRLDYT